jgi:pimeloyl-ACP methyl ester carboxylesterase
MGYMNKRRKEIIAGNKVSEIYEWNLGGYNQKVLIEGKDENLPIVITLHGSGAPIPFSVGCRGLFPEFTNQFIMVYWDQLGCGINNYLIDDSFSIASFVEMTVDLIHNVKKLFPRNKILILAMSWGSILSTKVLEKDSKIINGVLVYGQIVKEVFFNEEVIAALEKTKISKSKLEAIKRIKRENASSKDLQLVTRNIGQYTDGKQNKKGKPAPMGPIIKGFLTSPDYHFKDFKAIMINGYQKNFSLWREILQIDLSGILENVQIPYVILQGDTDLVASASTVKTLVRNSGNPNLQCEIVEDSGHMPGKEGMELVLEKLGRLSRNISVD